MLSVIRRESQPNSSKTEKGVALTLQAGQRPVEKAKQAWQRGWQGFPNRSRMFVNRSDSMHCCILKLKKDQCNLEIHFLSFHIDPAFLFSVSTPPAGCCVQNSKIKVDHEKMVSKVVCFDFKALLSKGWGLRRRANPERWSDYICLKSSQRSCGSVVYSLFVSKGCVLSSERAFV